MTAECIRRRRVQTRLIRPAGLLGLGEGVVDFHSGALDDHKSAFSNRSSVFAVSSIKRIQTLPSSMVFGGRVVVVMMY